MKYYRGDEDKASDSKESTKKKSTTTDAEPAYKWEKERQQVMEMGFGKQLVEVALDHTKGQVATAITLLTDPDGTKQERRKERTIFT